MAGISDAGFHVSERIFHRLGLHVLETHNSLGALLERKIPGALIVKIESVPVAPPLKESALRSMLELFAHQMGAPDYH